MATNQVIFDQVYKILAKVRSELRNNYDTSAGIRDMVVYFRMKGKKAVRCDEHDYINDTQESVFPIIVSWDTNNADLRCLAREVMHGLA